MASGLDLTELRQLQSRIDGLHTSKLTGATTKGTDRFAEAAQRNAPVLTGRLRGGFGAPRVVSVSDTQIEVEVSIDAHYAKYVIHGTRHMAPRDFVRDAWPQSERELTRLLSEAFEQAMR